MDILHVPSYAKHIKDIINTKWPLPSTKVIKLMKECSAAILNFPKKKKNHGCPTINAPSASNILTMPCATLGLA
jgi:hypothetical protein